MTIKKQIKQTEAEIKQVKHTLYQHYYWLWQYIAIWATLRTAEDRGLEYPLECQLKNGKRKVFTSAKELENIVLQYTIKAMTTFKYLS